jgi:hypothetical protein
MVGLPASSRGADEVEGAVLHVEHHRVESLAREALGDRRLVGADPGAEERRLRLQRLREHSDDRFAHSAFLPLDLSTDPADHYSELI